MPRVSGQISMLQKKNFTSLIVNMLLESNQAIILTDEKGDFIFCNDAMERLTEYTCSEMKDGFDELLFKDDELKKSREGLAVLLKKGWYATTRVLCKKNKVPINVLINSSLYEDAGKKYFLSFYTLIESINDCELRLSEQEQLYRKITKQSPISIIITDEEGNITYVNPFFEKTTGYSFDEVVGKNPRILKSDKNDPSTYKELWETITNGNNWFGELQNKKKDGTLFWEHMVISPVRDSQGKISHFVAVKEDITERKSMEDELRLQKETLEKKFVQRTRALRESQERFKTLATESFEGIVLHDGKKFIDVNKAFLKMTGYNREDLIGKNIVGLVSKDDLKKVLLAAQRGRREKIFNKVLKKDGDYLSVEIQVKKITYRRKKIFLNAIKDLTEENKNERLRNEFLSITSHELRTPLTPMSAQLQMILAGFYGPINDEQRESLDLILRNTKRLNNLIGDILDISKLSSGNMKFNMRKNSISRIIDDCAKTMLPEARRKNISFTFVKPRIRIPSFVFDHDRMTQVICNLVNNAIKFTPKKGSVRISLSKAKDRVTIKISDSGVGIRKKDQKKIFQPFQQADSSSTRAFEGSGIGLAICKGIVENHKGSITVESTLKKGSTFTVVIPTTLKVEENSEKKVI